MKILIASTPVPGHLNPLLAIASLLVESGHQVAAQVDEHQRPAVEAAGLRFLSEIPNAQTTTGYYLDNYPARMQKSPGMEMAGYDLVHYMARNIAAWFASLKMALYDFHADLILADSTYWGTLPMLLGVLLISSDHDGSRGFSLINRAAINHYPYGGQAP
jgi:UDP:flavonoid glycosyltransferase YjiC (YdhE family)